MSNTLDMTAGRIYSVFSAGASIMGMLAFVRPNIIGLNTITPSVYALYLPCMCLYAYTAFSLIENDIYCNRLLPLTADVVVGYLLAKNAGSGINIFSLVLIVQIVILILFIFCTKRKLEFLNECEKIVQTYQASHAPGAFAASGSTVKSVKTTSKSPKKKTLSEYLYDFSTKNRQAKITESEDGFDINAVANGSDSKEHNIHYSAEETNHTGIFVLSDYGETLKERQLPDGAKLEIIEICKKYGLNEFKKDEGNLSMIIDTNTQNFSKAFDKYVKAVSEICSISYSHD